MVYFIEPTIAEGRHLYAKSPFRTVSLKHRLTEDAPKTLNLMPFAFPDDNIGGGNSSESEDEASPAILSIGKLSNCNNSFDKQITDTMDNSHNFSKNYMHRNLYTKEILEEPISA